MSVCVGLKVCRFKITSTADFFRGIRFVRKCLRWRFFFFFSHTSSFRIGLEDLVRIGSFSSRPSIMPLSVHMAWISATTALSIITSQDLESFFSCEEWLEFSKWGSPDKNKTPWPILHLEFRDLSRGRAFSAAGESREMNRPCSKRETLTEIWGWWLRFPGTCDVGECKVTSWERTNPMMCCVGRPIHLVRGKIKGAVHSWQTQYHAFRDLVSEWCVCAS